MAIPAHAGHWVESIAFALPPILLVGGIMIAAVAARRAERREHSHS